MTRDDLLGLLSHDNVSAFLHVIRQGETNQTDDAYRMMFGGKLFDSFEDHPRVRHPFRNTYTTAAGAYQFLSRTWDEVAKQYGLNDFGPTNQDLGACALIVRRRAMDDVLAGRVHEAIRKCSNEWASLPGSQYGQPTQKLQKALEVYRQFGGRLSGDSDSPTPKAEVKKSMAAPILAFLPQILSAIPSLISVLGSPNDSEVAKRNQAAGVLVAETLVKATNAVNLQDAVERIESDPEALRAAKDAIDDLLPTITDGAGGGVKAAREFAESHMDGRGGRVLEVITYAALVFLAVANGLALTVYLKGTDSALLNTVIQADIGAALMALGFWLGTSASSQKKTALIGK